MRGERSRKEDGSLHQKANTCTHTQPVSFFHTESYTHINKEIFILFNIHTFTHTKNKYSTE